MFCLTFPLHCLIHNPDRGSDTIQDGGKYIKKKQKKWQALPPGSKVLTPHNRLSVTRSWNWSTWANGDVSRKCSTQQMTWHSWPISQNRNRSPGGTVRSPRGEWWVWQHPKWRTDPNTSTAHHGGGGAWRPLHTTPNISYFIKSVCHISSLLF